MDFDGEIKDDMKGLYRSSYYDSLFFSKLVFLPFFLFKIKPQKESSIQMERILISFFFSSFLNVWRFSVVFVVSDTWQPRFQQQPMPEKFFHALMSRHSRRHLISPSRIRIIMSPLRTRSRKA
jgi:hypothetical protein